MNGAPEAASSSSHSAEVLVGMVHDGSRCGTDSMCVGGECVSVHHVMPVTCVTGRNGLVCSGHGVSLSLSRKPFSSILYLQYFTGVGTETGRASCL